jgi:hypothetical protein
MRCLCEVTDKKMKDEVEIFPENDLYADKNELIEYPGL